MICKSIQSLKRICSNVYELVIPHSLRINSVFNIKDLTIYRSPFDYPVVILDLSSSTSPGYRHFPIHTPSPLTLQKHCLVEIENILENEIISIANGEYQYYLVHYISNQIQVTLGCTSRRPSCLIWICLMNITFAIHQIFIFPNRKELVEDG